MVTKYSTHTKTQKCKDLFTELFFTKFVERVELLGEYEILLEAAAGQLHADDNGAVRNHHCY